MTVKIEKILDGYVLKSELEINSPLEDVFPFFADPKNLERITPSFLNFKIKSMSDSEMREGLTISYRLGFHGIPVRWTSLISKWDPPCSFIDEQKSGPFKSWRHLHLFVPAEGRTVVRDVVNYQVYGGEIIHKIFVKRDLLKIFELRREELKKIFDVEEKSGFPSVLSQVAQAGTNFKG